MECWNNRASERQFFFLFYERNLRDGQFKAGVTLILFFIYPHTGFHAQGYFTGMHIRAPATMSTPSQQDRGKGKDTRGPFSGKSAS